MKISIPKESIEFERRVAASPETVKKYVALGCDVTVQKGAGLASNVPDKAYEEAGAKIAASYEACVKDADLVLKVREPKLDKDNELKPLKSGALLIGMLSPYTNKDHFKAYEKAGVTTCSLELIPRISRAQAMDVLSSQSNLAGYRSVLDATYAFDRALPMMMTAAGTVPPARVLVLGAGVAGLQAIATAKRLGAVVSAFDVRAAAKEQVQSLGATFIEVDPDAGTDNNGVYAKETSEDYRKRQADKIHETLKKSDIAICTALIPGKKAPTLITQDMVKDMKPGSVIVDMAVEMGGNCEGSQLGQVVEMGMVKILGHANIPSRIAEDASRLYAKNILNFLTLLLSQKDGKVTGINLNLDDEIIKGCVLTHDGATIHESFKV